MKTNMNWKKPYVFHYDRANYKGVVWIKVANGYAKAERYFNESDWRIVRCYTRAMKRSNRFSMIDIVSRGKTRFTVTDGNHRFLACKSLGIKHIPEKEFRMRLNINTDQCAAIRRVPRCPEVEFYCILKIGHRGDHKDNSGKKWVNDEDEKRAFSNT
jgi:hypothetical protein